jgi:hypothetical protein
MQCAPQADYSHVAAGNVLLREPLDGAGKPRLRDLLQQAQVRDLRRTRPCDAVFQLS